MAQTKAFIFDLNGTMIDDMQYHSAAWFSILNDDLRAGLTRAEVDKQMYGKNEEMAIGSAAINFNIDFVLDNLHIRHYFGAIVSADDVTVSKPDPETFTKAAVLLGVPHGDCIVFEDAPKGVEAALRAGMRSIVLTTMHEKEEFSRYSNVIRFIKDYTDPSLDELFI
jgi:beta-phosphoglucomutase